MNANRATVLFVVGLLVVSSVGAVAGTAVAASTTASQASSSGTYVVEQGEFCREIEPLTTNESIESFYDYRDHETHPEGVDRLYSSYGTTHLQESDTSLLFLHRGTDGTSLTMVHDELDGGTRGGVATFDIVGLPHDAEWAVRNDAYDAETNRDEFDRGDGWASASWAWIEDRTAGGAIRGGFGEPFAVTIHPRFNEDAELYDEEIVAEFEDENRTAYGGEYYWDSGEIDGVTVLSGDAEAPERLELASTDEPITIRTGTCEGPAISYDRTDDGIAATVTDPSPHDRVVLQPTTGTGDEVRFERIDASGFRDTTTIEFESSRPENLPASTNGTDPIGQLTVTENASASATVSGTVTFTVDADYLAERQLDPDDVVLYEADGGEWNETATEVVADRGGVYQFEAEFTTDEAIAVAPSPDAGTGGAVGSTASYMGGAAIGSLLLFALLWVAGRNR